MLQFLDYERYFIEAVIFKVKFIDIKISGNSCSKLEGVFRINKTDFLILNLFTWIQMFYNEGCANFLNKK